MLLTCSPHERVLGCPKNLVRGERGGRGKTEVQNLLWIFLGPKMMEREIKTQI